MPGLSYYNVGYENEFVYICNLFNYFWQTTRD